MQIDKAWFSKWFAGVNEKANVYEQYKLLEKTITEIVNAALLFPQWTPELFFNLCWGTYIIDFLTAASVSNRQPNANPLEPTLSLLDIRAIQFIFDVCYEPKFLLLMKKILH